MGRDNHHDVVGIEYLVGAEFRISFPVPFGETAMQEEIADAAVGLTTACAFEPCLCVFDQELTDKRQVSLNLQGQVGDVCSHGRLLWVVLVICIAP